MAMIGSIPITAFQSRKGKKMESTARAYSFMDDLRGQPRADCGDYPLCGALEFIGRKYAICDIKDCQVKPSECYECWWDTPDVRKMGIS